LYPTLNIHGKNVVTIEGISDGVKLDPVQDAMIEKGGVQCGFCTSGIVVSIKGMQNKFKKEKRVPTKDEIKKGLEGNLCRCTGYVKIVEAAEKVLNNN
jgi:carbon-monoxide dehydrogenase small subunit